MVSVTSTASANGSYAGIIAQNQSVTGTGVAINAVDLTAGGGKAVQAINNGTGDIFIAATGYVQSVNSDAITATDAALGANIIITAYNTRGGTAILANSQGTGAISITSTGESTGLGPSGISATNAATGTNITINAATTNGGDRGTEAISGGRGAISITATGTSSGTRKEGIFAKNSAAGTDITINAAATTGGYRGIYAKNLGTGAINITAIGTATGGSRDGIFAENTTTGTGITIAAATTLGNQNGILAVQRGSGALKVTATGTTNVGIAAQTYGASTGLTVNAADTVGRGVGIEVQNRGGGATTITSTGTATGNGLGIRATKNYAGVGTSTDLTITAASALGGVTGIGTVNLGSGDLTVTTTGTVRGTSQSGISAQSRGTGNISINVNPGLVEGGFGAITAAPGAYGSAGTVTITNAGTLRNTSNVIDGNVISSFLKAGITNTGLVRGRVNLSDFTDTFTNAASGTWETGVYNQFGAGTDMVRNRGLVITAENAGLAEQGDFFGLETFSNQASGILSMTDGGRGIRPKPVAILWAAAGRW